MPAVLLAALLSGLAAAWTDPTLVENATRVRAVHIEELRAAVNQKRTALGLPARAWTDPILQPNLTKIRAVHVLELRQAVNEAYAAASQPSPSWTDPVLTGNATKIRAIHVRELRQRIDVLPTCACGVWTDGGCGQGGCYNQRLQTRACSPAGCQAQARCVADAACEPPPCAGNGAGCGSDGECCSGFCLRGACQPDNRPPCDFQCMSFSVGGTCYTCQSAFPIPCGNCSVQGDCHDLCKR